MGEVGSEDAAAFQQVEQSKDAQQQFAELERTWDAVESYKQGFQPDVEAGWERFAGRMQASKAAKTKVVPLRSRLRMISAVAAGLFVLVVAWFAFQTSNSTITAKATSNEQIALALPDGSTVYLNANSVLSYPETFEGGRTTE